MTQEQHGLFISFQNTDQDMEEDERTLKRSEFVNFDTTQGVNMSKLNYDRRKCYPPDLQKARTCLLEPKEVETQLVHECKVCPNLSRATCPITKFNNRTKEWNQCVKNRPNQRKLERECVVSIFNFHFSFLLLGYGEHF